VLMQMSKLPEKQAMMVACGWAVAWRSMAMTVAADTAAGAVMSTVVVAAMMAAAAMALTAVSAKVVTPATATEAAVGLVLTSVGEEMAVATTAVMVVAVSEEGRSSIRPPTTSHAREGEGDARRLTPRIHRRRLQG
jgi:uncharacterized membrane protein YkgB